MEMLSDSGFAAYLCKAGGLQLNFTVYLTEPFAKPSKISDFIPLNGYF